MASLPGFGVTLAVLLIATLSHQVQALCSPPDGIYIASFGSDTVGCGSQSQPCATVAMALGRVTAQEGCRLEANLMLASALDGTVEGNYDLLVDDSFNFHSFSFNGMGMSVDLDSTEFLDIRGIEGSITVENLSFTGCTTCVFIESRSGASVEAFRLIGSGSTQTLLSATVSGRITIDTLSTYESGGEDGCSGFNLNLENNATATISSIAGSRVRAGHEGVFCITASATSVVSISTASVSSSSGGLSDEGGAFTLRGGVIAVDNVLISDIDADFGSGIFAEGFTSLSITNSVFEQLGDDQRSNAGGAIRASSYLPGSYFALQNCTSSFTAVGGYAGGFLLLEGTSSAVIDSNQLVASYCNYGFGGFVMLRDVTNTAISNTIFAEGYASKGGGIACVNSTGTTLEVVQFQDMASTSLSAETIDLFGYNCTSPIWNSQQECPTISCSSCQSSVCGQDPPLAVCSCYCTGIGDDCDSANPPSTTEPLPSATRTPTASLIVTPTPTPTISASSFVSAKPESPLSSDEGEEGPGQIPFAVGATLALLGMILIFVLIGFLAVFGFFAYVKYFKSDATVPAPNYDPIAMADPITPQREGDKYQYEVEDE